MAALTELSQAARRWSARPGFAATVILTLTLGIGVATAIFSVVDGVLLRPLPWREPDRLVSAWIVRPHWRQNPVLAPSADRGSLSWPNFRDLQQQAATLQSVAIWSHVRLLLDGPEAKVVPAMRVSSTFLDTLGTRPSVGRNFLPHEDDDPTDSVLLSHEAWLDQFGGEANVVGRKVTLDETSRTIVGVLPPGFRFEGDAPEFLIPMGEADKRGRNRGNHLYRAIARLAPGVALEQAQLDTEPILRMDMDPKTRTSRLQQLAEQQLGASRRPLAILLAAAMLLLLVACANVAALLLADVRSRRHELAVRAALGAGRARVARALLVEALMLAAASACLGLILALWLTPVLVSLAPPQLPRLEAVSIDARAFGFAVLLSIMTTGICGAGMALAAASTDPSAALSEGGRGGTRRQRGQNVMVISEIALALALLAGAGLLAETARRMRAEPLGFRSDNLAVLTVRAPRSMRVAASPAAHVARTAAIENALAAVPGVVGAAGSASVPFGGGYGSNGIEIEGKQIDPSPSARNQIVTDAFFRTMQIPIVRGRAFEPSDSSSGKLAVVSEEFERRYLDGDALGKRFRLNQDWLEVIGVAANTKQRGLTEEDEPVFFGLGRQLPAWGINEYVVRAAADPAALIPALREAVRAVDPRLAVSTAATMDTLILDSIAGERYRALLSSMFGFTALVLSAIGVYGLLARDVADRRRELGLRVALGARPSDVVRLVARQGLLLAGCGLLAGIPAALGAGRAIAALLHGVTPASPAVLAGVSAALLAAAAVATLIPAMRASRIDPVILLRES